MNQMRFLPSSGSMSSMSLMYSSLPRICFKNGFVKSMSQSFFIKNIFPTILPAIKKCNKWSGIRYENGFGCRVYPFLLTTQRPFSGSKRSFTKRLSHSLVRPPWSMPPSFSKFTLNLARANCFGWCWIRHFIESVQISLRFTWIEIVVWLKFSFWAS